MLIFKDYADKFIIRKRIEEQGFYDYHKVESNFYKVLDILGELDKRDLIVNIDVRLKGQATWDECNSYARGLHIKISQRFWGRKSKYHKFPFVRSIESKQRANGYIKDHLHMMIKMIDLKQYYEPIEIEQIIKEIAYDMDEVNSKDKGDKPAVNISNFPYWENEDKKLGRRIEYICKSTTDFYDPLAQGLYKD